MLWAEREQADRIRAIQAAQRQEHANQRAWLGGDPILVIDAHDEILKQEPEDNVVVDEPEEVEPPEIALVPEEEQEENLEDVAREDEDFILDFVAENAPEVALMDGQQLQNLIQGLQDEIAALRNDQNRIELHNDLQVQNIENQVTNLEMEHQNNLPGLLPTVAPNSLLKVFTGDDISETWQDWLDNFTLATRACN